MDIARIVAARITDGSLRAGDAMPSVRTAAVQHRVSVGTIVQAYGVLETQGLIEARPRSGHVVRQRRSTDLPQAALRRPGLVRGSRHERLQRILGDLTTSASTLLGSSFPDPALFPLADLRRSLALGMRDPRLGVPAPDSLLGLAELRRLIAQRYVEQGYSVAIDGIMITSGGMEAVHLALRTVTRPGDLVLIDSPMFFAGLQLLDHLGLKKIEVPTQVDEGLDLGQLDRTLRQYKVAACLLMTNCHNPLGFSMSEEKKRALVTLLARHEVPMVENDVYTELQFDGRHARAAKAFDAQGLVLHCGSFTKSLAPGYKVGWLAAGRYHAEAVAAKFVTTLGTSTPPQVAIAHYLKNEPYERHLRSLRQTLQTRMHHMMQGIERHFPAGTRYTRPGGGYVLWVQLPDRVDALVLFDLAARSDIGIAPGPVFSASQGYGNFIRLNGSHPWSATMDDTIRWLGQQVAGLM